MSTSSRALAPGPFLGRSVGGGRVGAFRWDESAYAPDVELPAHAHELATVVLAIDGGYVERTDGRSHQCGPRSVYFRPARAPHEDQFERRGARVFSLELPRGWLDAALERATLDARPLQVCDPTAATLALRLRRECRESDDVAALLCEGLLLELLAHAARATHAERSDRRAPWLDPVVELLRARPGRTPGLGELARAVDVPPRRLARAFRSRFGESLGAYARRARFEEACRRIALTSVPLARIALESGFADQAHLSREFRRFAGTTPSRFRAAAGVRGVQARRDVQDARPAAG